MIRRHQHECLVQVEFRDPHSDRCLGTVDVGAAISTGGGSLFIGESDQTPGGGSIIVRPLADPSDTVADRLADVQRVWLIPFDDGIDSRTSRVRLRSAQGQPKYSTHSGTPGSQNPPKRLKHLADLQQNP